MLVPMAIEPHLDEWLAALDDRVGSDLLVTVGSPPLLRVDGALLPLATANLLSAADVERIASAQLGEDMWARLEAERELDFSFTWRDAARIRGNAFYQRGNCSLALRRIPMDMPTPEQLGLPTGIIDVLRKPSGLILVTGPTGSGKSTSLAAMIDLINRTRACHIVTLEDPIEYLHSNKMAAISQREIGIDTHSFPRALRSVLREDPDVVLVGEMRDPESIQATLTVAETGHLVLATLHTNDSAQALDRIVDVFPSDGRPQIQVQLAGTLLAVVYQRLVARREGGMVAAYEVMIGNSAVRNLVREGKTRQLRNAVSTHRGDGMQTLERSLTELIDAGVVDYQVALEASLYPQEIPRPLHAVAGRTR
jgi:twitching motility protein PilT